MRMTFFVLASLVLSCNSSQKTVSETTNTTNTKDYSITYASTITEEELKEHLYIYASDEFEGRETGAPGQKKAVEYLKNAYETLGIPPAKENGNYFQKVPLQMGSVPKGTITINESVFEIGEEVLVTTPITASFEEVIYVGYGIEEGTYSDFVTIDVRGKVILVKSGEPKNQDGTYVLSGTKEKSKWSDMSASLGKRVELAFQKGAKGILYLDNDNYPRYKRSFNFMKNNSRMQLKEDNGDNFIALLNEKSATVVKRDILTNETPEALSVSLNLDIAIDGDQIDTENVLAVLKGSEKPNEYVVVSSHLDHIGVTEDGRINNGADDDGSGTVALLEIAEAFKKAADEGHGPKRSILFLHVTGEEKGLLGSKYYTDYDPVFPLSQTVANLNIDMIGRIDPKREGNRNYIYLIGSDKLSTELHHLSEEVNEKYANLELDYTYNDENDPNRFYYRSDHYNFAKNNIPIIFYFNGTHPDYHKPTDTPDKINYDLLQNRTRLIFHTAWEVANRANKVAVDKVSK